MIIYWYWWVIWRSIIKLIIRIQILRSFFFLLFLRLILNLFISYLIFFILFWKRLILLTFVLLIHWIIKVNLLNQLLIFLWVLSLIWMFNVFSCGNNIKSWRKMTCFNSLILVMTLIYLNWVVNLLLVIWKRIWINIGMIIKILRCVLLSSVQIWSWVFYFFI